MLVFVFIYFFCGCKMNENFSICNSNIDNNNFNCCLRAQNATVHKNAMQDELKKKAYKFNCFSFD